MRQGALQKIRVAVAVAEELRHLVAAHPVEKAVKHRVRRRRIGKILGTDARQLHNKRRHRRGFGRLYQGIKLPAVFIDTAEGDDLPRKLRRFKVDKILHAGKGFLFFYLSAIHKKNRKPKPPVQMVFYSISSVGASGAFFLTDSMPFRQLALAL